MKKTMLALSLIAAAVPVSSAFASDAQFYGRAWLGLTNSDNGVLANRKENGTQLENFASFLGLKGDEKLSDNLKVIYVAEFGTEGYYDTSELFTPRNTYIGVAGNLGSIVFGRNDTVFKKTEGKVDLFNITSADMAKLISGNDRLGDSVTYYSPKLSGIQFGSSYQFADNTSSSSGNYAVSATIGDSRLKKDNYYVAVAYADGLNQLDAYRVVGGTKLAGIHWGALVQHAKSDKYENLSGNSYLLSAALPFDQYQLKLQYLYDKAGLGKITGNLADKSSVTDTNSYLVSCGLDYSASKATTIGVIASYLNGNVTDKNGYQDYDDTQFTVYLKQLF
ncbi:porin [Shewanella yunxiaonensis]|uniref:Porin n=1 Tax=Shewanella yunxiaonensis TaxID=2829809 RepID=A0ABX7YSC1_9GAMM|nr:MULTISPECIES: porin [Shewanella]MDF0533830.1 porin [Shewanella sp. A32]QUN05021.1 porin [Shewanella yunxiaonensis]